MYFESLARLDAVGELQDLLFVFVYIWDLIFFAYILLILNFCCIDMAVIWVYDRLVLCLHNQCGIKHDIPLAT